MSRLVDRSFPAIHGWMIGVEERSGVDASIFEMLDASLNDRSLRESGKYESPSDYDR
jgi:hypothetical protein